MDKQKQAFLRMPDPDEPGTETPFYRCVMTEKGIVLLAKQQLLIAQYGDMDISTILQMDESVRIRVTRAVAGEGWGDPALLEQQTEVGDPIAEMEMGPHELLPSDKRAVRLCFRLSSEKLKETALIRQVGVYAMDPDEGEILYTILQYRRDAPQPLSSVEASYGAISYFESDITLVFANGKATAIPQSPSWFATKSDMDKIYPTERIAVISHGLERYPRDIELYHTRHALGAGGLGEGPLGGENAVSVPIRAELMDIYKVGILVPRHYARMGEVEVIRLAEQTYSFVPKIPTKQADSLYLMMR